MAVMRPRLIAALSLLLSTPALATRVLVLPTQKVQGRWLPAGGDWIGFAAGNRNGIGGGGPGVHGVELRGGDNAARAQWEIGVGRATSQADFTSAHWDWGCGNSSPRGCGTWSPFRLEWRPDRLAFSLGSGAGLRTVMAPAGAGLIGNTLRIHAKGDAEFRLDGIDGQAMTLAGDGLAANFSDAFYLFSPKRWGGDGFVATGSLRIKGGGNAARGLTISAGDFSPHGPIPEPGVWAMLIVGFGLTGAVLRRRRGYLATL